MTQRLYLRDSTHPHATKREMEAIGVGPEGMDIMVPKARWHCFRVRDMDPRGANILKQELLAVGAEAALAYHAISDLSRPTGALVFGNGRALSLAMEKLKRQPFGLKALAADLENALESLGSPSGKLKVGSVEFDLGQRTLVMGVLNVTPDSFSDGGQYLNAEAAVARGLELADQGADIIDVGGESTRPGAEPVTGQEELDRVLPVIRGLAGRTGVPLSIDTRKPEVARQALEAGASMVNLVGGLRDEYMARLIAEAKVPVVLMHMLGAPATMQDSPQYEDVMDDIVDTLREQVAGALDAGIDRRNIIVDPGIGFGKTVEHNLEILARLGELRILGLPILVGASRKSFIGRLSGTEVEERLEGSLASAAIAIANGANIVRAHDVRETRRALEVADAILASSKVINIH